MQLSFGCHDTMLGDSSHWGLSVSWQFPPSMVESSSNRARPALMVPSLLSDTDCEVQVV